MKKTLHSIKRNVFSFVFKPCKKATTFFSIRRQKKTLACALSERMAFEEKEHIQEIAKQTDVDYTFAYAAFRSCFEAKLRRRNLKQLQALRILFDIPKAAASFAIQLPLQKKTQFLLNGPSHSVSEVKKAPSISLKNLCAEIQGGAIYEWADGTLALTKEMPQTSIEACKTLPIIEPAFLKVAIDRLMKAGSHQIPFSFLLPQKKGGFFSCHSITLTSNTKDNQLFITLEVEIEEKRISHTASFPLDGEAKEKVIQRIARDQTLERTLLAAKAGLMRKSREQL